MRAEIRELEKGLFLIDDAGDSTCYLLCGEKEAALIDTANGQEDLRALVEGLTSLRVTVINTHGHCDHIGGNIFFDEAWIHPADEALALEHFSFMKEEMEKFGKQPCPFRHLEIGQVFDLGGLTLEVVALTGHTAGSVGLLCREKRLLFTGDGMNPHIWMQLEESLPLSVYRKTLQEVKERFWPLYDRVLFGHAHGDGYRDKSLLDQLMQGLNDLLAGNCQADTTYTYFGGQATCLQHPISDVPGEVIVYNEEKRK